MIGNERVDVAGPISNGHVVMDLPENMCGDVKSYIRGLFEECVRGVISGCV